VGGRLIGNDKFVSLFGMVPAGDLESLIPVVSNAVREGIAIVLNHPGTKKPLCILTPADRNKADKAARDAAASMGDPRWHMRKHDCGLSHALTVESLGGDPAKVRTKVGAVIRRMTKVHGATPNIGVEVGLSNLLVVDVDTQAEADGFASDWGKSTGDRLPGMTVSSPGKKNEAGKWVHKHGGHYWFTIPAGVEMPAGQGIYKAPAGWVAMWNRHQVLVPPSVREEGPYEIVGQINVGPEWLTGRLVTEAEARIDRAGKKSQLPDGTGDIDQYFAALPWTDLLLPEGWEDTGLVDRCSCPVFTAPGDHSSPKSATAHDAGCNRPEFDASMGHWPIHVWTDTGPEWLQDAIRRTGHKTFTKLQWLAWRDHDGASRAVLNELGLNAVDEEFSGAYVPDDFESPLAKSMREQAEALSAPETASFDPFETAGPGGGEEAAQTPTDAGASAPEPAPSVDPVEAFLGQLKSSEELESIEDPEFLIEGIMDLDTVTRITGKSGHGKTFVMMDMSACIAMGRPWHGYPVTQGLVVYMVAEGARGWRKRLRAWEKRYLDGAFIPKEALMILPMPIQSTNREEWNLWRMALSRLKPSLVIMDTQARVTVGVDENDAKEMGIFVERLEQIRRETGACVVTVHHLGHEGQHGRGSTAVVGALGSEIRVKKTAPGKLQVECEKMKDAEEFEPIKFELETVVLGESPSKKHDSAILKRDGWDPYADEFDAPEQVAEKDSIEYRIIRYLWHEKYMTGATQTEVRKALRDDQMMKYGDTKGLSDGNVNKVWQRLIEEEKIEPKTGRVTRTGAFVTSEAVVKALGVPLLRVAPSLPPAGGIAGDDTSEPEEGEAGAANTA